MPMKNKSSAGSNRLTNLIIRIASIFVSVAALGYLGYHFVESFSSDIETEYATLITENDVVSLDAYILRTESIVYASTSTSTHSVGYVVPDGTKVHGGQTVASVYAGSGDDEAILEIDQRIDLLEASALTDGMTSSDTNVLDTRIQDYYFSIKQATSLGDFTNLSKRRDSMLTLINKRALITGAADSYADRIESLTAEINLLSASQESVTETVAAPSAGYFYSTEDGYEAMFSAKKADRLTLDEFDRMTASKPAVYSDRAVGKLSTDFDWYIVTETTRDSLRYFQKNRSYTVNFPFNDDTAFEMELTNIVSEVGNDRVLLIFRGSRIPQDFSFRRMQPVELVRSSYTGYKVPISSVRLVDGIPGVFILVGNTVEFRRIEILLEMDGYYIVSSEKALSDAETNESTVKPLSLYDQIIISGKNLYDGKLIS